MRLFGFFPGRSNSITFLSLHVCTEHPGHAATRQRGIVILFCIFHPLNGIQLLGICIHPLCCRLPLLHFHIHSHTRTHMHTQVPMAEQGGRSLLLRGSSSCARGRSPGLSPNRSSAGWTAACRPLSNVCIHLSAVRLLL
jgi:hypothetical protein